ncbi:MAG: hypothetical protein Q4G33_02645 [bacterium]|nr:hypothetical protein [bacterium]
MQNDRKAEQPLTAFSITQTYNPKSFRQCVWENRSKQIAVMRGAVVRCTSST